MSGTSLRTTSSTLEASVTTSLVIASIPPERVEWWRRFADHLRHDQAAPRAEWQRRHDVDRITIWVTPQDQVIVLTEGRDLIEVLDRMRRSDDGFDRWMGDWLRQLAGDDPLEWATDRCVEPVIDTRPDSGGWRGWPR